MPHPIAFASPPPAQTNAAPARPSAEADPRLLATESRDTWVARVAILWGDQVLKVAHVAPNQSFTVGDLDAARAGQQAVDFVLPNVGNGPGFWPLITSGAGGFALHLPAEVDGQVCGGELAPDNATRTVSELRPRLAHSPALPGGTCLSLTADCRSQLVVGDLTFEVTLVPQSSVAFRAGALALDTAALAYFAGSWVATGALLAAAAFLVPPLGLTAGEDITHDDLILIQQLLAASAEREQTPEETNDAQDPSPEGGTGEQAAGDSGAMGKPTETAKNRRFAVKQVDDLPPQLARQAFLEEAASFGMIGLLGSAAAGDPNAPTAPWGRDIASGLDTLSAQGAMWGDTIGEAGGVGGLGLLGGGEGGGGLGQGIGLDALGTIGHGRGGIDGGQGLGPGGLGLSHGRVQTSHRPRVPHVRMAQPVLSGRLPKEVIQRAVRQNYGRFRLCYEKGLVRNPNLEGRVSVRFVISRSGAVSMAANAGSTLPDDSVVNCVVRAYYGISFPKPEEGIVTVAYPIAFSPD